MSDQPTMSCPRTLAVYARLQPVLSKLPESVTKEVRQVAGNACAAESGASLLVNLANAAAEITRQR